MPLYPNGRGKPLKRVKVRVQISSRARYSHYERLPMIKFTTAYNRMISFEWDLIWSETEVIMTITRSGSKEIVSQIFVDPQEMINKLQLVMTEKSDPNSR